MKAVKIHPNEKIFVGQRLAGCALNKVYGLDCKWKSPVMKCIEVKNGVLKIYFDYTYGKLFASCSELCDISVKDTLKLWHCYKTEPAEDHLEVQIGDIDITKVRFCYTNNPSIRIFNKYGLPAIPFEYDFSGEDI